MSTTAGPTPDDVRAACNAISHCLENQTYAIVGGGALTLLGSTRETRAIDFVVPQGETKNARALLRNDPTNFEIDPKTNHTHYKSTPPVEIQILAPPGLYKPPFDASTPTISIDGVKVLKPTLILNAKCHSILNPISPSGKMADAQDIKSLLWWCVSEQGKAHNCAPTASEVPNATWEFVGWFIGLYQGQPLWANAGFDSATGRFP